MSKRYISIAAVTAVLAVVALLGYGWPVSEPLLPVKDLPERILLDQHGASGKVVFDHKKHFENYKIECQDCHHDREKPTPIAQACRSCHGAVNEPNFKTEHVTAFSDQMSCVTCHHMEFAGINWDREEHLLNRTNGEDPMSGLPESKTGDKAYADEAHARCATPDCHGDLFSEEGDMSQCGTCHNLVNTKTTLRDKGWITINPAYADCTVCHTGQAIEDLILPRMQAFHTSCMGCHEKLQKGPYGQDTCNQCHTK